MALVEARVVWFMDFSVYEDAMALIVIVSREPAISPDYMTSLDF